jgi:hypothetical protein
MPLQGRLSIEHMCQLVAVSRRGFYRSLRQREPAEEETEVRSLIQQIALEHRRRYGYRRITAELHRRGVPVNRKKVARMMRDDNLLAIQPKRFVVTTNSKHKCEVYLNLASRMTLTGINQLWVADITYVRLKGEFVYLAVILDSYSRKVVGWAVDRTSTAIDCGSTAPVDMLKINEFELPPLGAGLKTVTAAVPAAAISLAEIWAISPLMLPLLLVGRSLPFQRTTELATKLFPTTVN